MGYFLIAMLGFVVLFVIGFLKEKDIDLAIVIGLLGAMISLIPILITSAFIHGLNSQEVYELDEIKMVALKDHVSASGSFFLGSGTVKDEMKYFYMVKTDKGMKIDSVGAESSFLIEDDNLDAKIVTNAYRFKNKQLQFWFPSWYSSYKTIHIPKGSIDCNYRVNLE